MHFSAACSVGKWPRAFTARRIRALMLSIALVVQITVRISLSNCRNGTNSAHALVQSPMMAGYRFSHLPANSAGPARCLARRGIDGLEVLGDLRPVLPRGIAEAVAQQVNDACLHDGLRPHGRDCIRQALEAIADHDAAVGHAAVLDLGQHPQPVLRTLAVAVLAGPEPEDVPGPVHRDGQGDVDRRFATWPSRIFTFTQSMKITGYTGSSGRFCHSPIPSSTRSVIVEMVCLDTSAP
jgi:hypothetical protein